MPNEPIGKGRRAIFGGPQPSELKDKAQEDLGLSLKDKAQEAEAIKPENQGVEILKPEGSSLKDDNLKDEGLNLEVLRKVVNDAQGSKKTIAIWSPTISAALWYLKATTPMYSISDAAREWVEDGLERDHPDLMKRIKEEIKRN